MLLFLAFTVLSQKGWPNTQASSPRAKAESLTYKQGGQHCAPPETRRTTCAHVVFGSIGRMKYPPFWDT